MNYYNLLLVLILTPFCSCEVPSLPSFLKPCHRSDPHLNLCIKEAVEHLRPLLAKGIPEFDIPSCEPLYISEVFIDEGSGAVSLKSNYKDIEVFGPSMFELRSIKIDLDKDKMKMKVWLPRLELISKYTMDGRILMMPISGEGITKGNYTDVDSTINIQGQKIQKDGFTYFNVKDFNVDFNIGHATIYLDNLFDGDKELGEAMNLFINDNWKHVVNEIQPIIEDTIATICKRLANRIFHKYPLEVLLPL